MKHSILFLLLITFSFAKAQSYQANNEVTLFVKEKGKYRTFYSKALFSKLNMETSEFLFQVDFNTFVPGDTNKISLAKIFPVQTSPFLCFKGTLPFNSLDKGSGTTQSAVILGSLIVASQNYELSLPVDFEFMDKQLMFHTNFSLDLNRLNITLPLEYRNTVLPVMLVRIDNGHFIKKE